MKITFRKVSKQSVLERMMKNKLQIGELSVTDRAVNETRMDLFVFPRPPEQRRCPGPH